MVTKNGSTFSWFVLLVTVLIVGGCGFASRNLKTLPTELNNIYYQADSPYAEFEVGLKRKLVGSGVTLLAKAEPSALILEVHYNYRNNSADSLSSSSTRARIYTLKYEAVVLIKDYYGKKVFGPRSVWVERNVTLQPNEIFGITSQVSLVKRELQAELANRVIELISSSKCAHSLAKVSHEDKV
jgi:Rare lipoprotein B